MLKQLLRDHIDPKRDLGHSDRGGKNKAEQAGEQGKETNLKEENSDSKEKVDKKSTGETVCTDCA